jgi:hypothetical protein
VPRSQTSARSATTKTPRKGSETPRLWTPPLRELHDTIRDAFGHVTAKATTRGFECIKFAEEVMEIHLLPWQKWLLVHALELNPDGTFRFRVVVLMVARQNGKSTLMQVLTLWRMYVDRAPLVIGTAQDLDVAEEQWQGAVDLADSIPELAAMIAVQGGVVRTNGKKALRIEQDVNGRTYTSRYKVKAATRRGARGLSGDLVLLDELREHQVWDAWAAVTKTTMAREHAQVWTASNAGDLSSVVLRYLRAQGHQGLDFPDGKENIAEGLRLLEALANDELDEEQLSIRDALDTLGLFEWSAHPSASIWDRDAWAQANPSMGYTIRETTIAAAAATDPEPVFRTEVLCQFVVSATMGPFPAGSWEATTDTAEDRKARGVKRDESRALTYCVEVSQDRKMAYVGVAYWDTEGRIRFQTVAQRAGTDWLRGWLQSPDRAVPVEHLTIQKGTPAAALIPDLTAPILDQYGDELAPGLTVTPWEGPLVAGWYGTFFDKLALSVDEENGELIVITHGVQPLVDLAATSANTKKLGNVDVIDRISSPQDVGPLMACIGAVGLLTTNPEPKRESAYETNDLMVV